MKLEQIRYILAIYKHGSISKAAKEFYISRPNISNAIKNLEGELGFEILERGTKGVQFTKKGMALVQRCINIQKEMDGIQNLATGQDRFQFSVVNPNCPVVENAFIRLCRDVNQLEGTYRLTMFREYQYEAMRLLNQKKADLAVTVSKDLLAPSLVQEMEERGLQYRKMWDVPCNINLSMNHPLASDPDFTLEKLKDYPIVLYAVEKDRGSPFALVPEVSFVDLSKCIRVDSGHMRTKVIAETNAYSIGIAMPPRWAEENGVCCIRVPNLTMEMGYIRRAGEPVSEPEERFMKYLMEEMSFL